MTLTEHHFFHLNSCNLKSLVSKEMDSDTIVGGDCNNKDIEVLEICIISSTYGCSSEIVSNCIYENVPEWPSQCKTISASTATSNKVPQVFSSAKKGEPVVLEEVISNKYSQWMETEEIGDFKKPHYRFW
ncbi:hypothetical protein BGZ93_009887 [Podila epicladia]|nr:hypothetical protein BGZ93_009887 [Podila epicladia]